MVFLLYTSIYPALVHSTALYDGKLYFNVNNAIYRMDPTIGAVEEVKEYNTVYGGIKLTKDKDGNMVPDTHFPGMSMVLSLIHIYKFAQNT